MPKADLLSIVQSLDAPLERRIEAAHALAQIGDPRLSGPSRVNVPAGPFTMGDPGTTVHLAAYSIDRFPVTVAAFGEFVDGGGYGARSAWSEEGWQWRHANAIERPRFWGDAEWTSYLVPNHPVIGVSYFEAEAYAAWIGARLPTEGEWEKAARGTDGRRYPWGAEWRDDACGMRGVGPRCTVPVGVFPKGESPYGAADLVGSVWQWCIDPFRGWGEGSDDALASGEALRRTTCGGAWNTLQWSVSTVGRNGYPVTARFSNLGFRCVADIGAD